MAILHRAELTPTKLELLEEWLAAAGALTRVGASRLDDPEGEVGIELLVVRTADGRLIHAPLTYRGAPLPDGEKWLIGTMEHSVLGTRWVYDAVGDPVFAAVLAETIRTGGQEAVEYVHSDDGVVARPSSMSLRGNGDKTLDGTRAELLNADGGDPAVIETSLGTLSVRRSLSAPEQPATGLTLTGSWQEAPAPVVLATLS